MGILGLILIDTEARRLGITLQEYMRILSKQCHPENNEIEGGY